MIVAYRTEERAFFLYGFAKNARDNIGVDELQSLRDLAVELLAGDDAVLEQAKAEGELQEIKNGETAE